MNNIIPTAIIGKDVILGSNNLILPYTIIEGNVEIGNNNIIGPQTVIGSPATDTKHINLGFENLMVKIGSNNTIREFCVVEQPCYENITEIQNDVFIMQGVHISHDALIANTSVLTNTTVIGGIAKILEGANIAMACTINQYTVIGQYSIVGTNSACMKNVKPFSRYIPNKNTSVNYYAIEKYNFQNYKNEIEKYVLENIRPESKKLLEIIEYFDYWVAKYGHSTY